MKDRGDTERIEVTQQSGMKAGGTMQPMLSPTTWTQLYARRTPEFPSSKTRHFSK